MKKSTGTIAATLAVGLLGTLLATQARASCTFTEVENATAAGWMQQQAIAGGALQHRALATTQANGAHAVRGAEYAGYVSIVGLWKFTFVAKGTTGIPDGTVLDAGYATWHGDGTELMNSSRPPKSGDFCMGVYKPTGHSSYALNHVTLSWDPTGSFFVGPGSIHELVTVDPSGNAYSGTFTIDQYAQDGTTVLAHLAGTVSATRITAD
jgi:hypothetical protein